MEKRNSSDREGYPPRITGNGNANEPRVKARKLAGAWHHMMQNWSDEGLPGVPVRYYHLIGGLAVNDH